MGFKVVEVQTTPNPNAMKYVLDGQVSPRPLSYFNVGAAKGNNFAEKLFEITGVTSLLFLGDFVTVNKTPDAKWAAITSKVKNVLAE